MTIPFTRHRKPLTVIASEAWQSSNCGQHGANAFASAATGLPRRKLLAMTIPFTRHHEPLIVIASEAWQSSNCGQHGANAFASAATGLPRPVPRHDIGGQG
jgi:hypothetical protein